MNTARSQHGGALAVMFLLLTATAAAFLYARQWSPTARERAAQAVTDAALASAKAALIGYAATTDITKSGPGNLLCPDQNDDGIAYSTGGGCGGSTAQSLRLGRLPWRTLGLPDVRDGAGERLWYAVSDNFRSFQAPNATNSDTAGTITVRDAAGNILYDASTGGGVAAVIIAPGTALTRKTSVSDATPRLQRRNTLDPRDYLELARGEDNADFTDNTQNGFIMGPVFGPDGTLISNDRIAVITRDELLAATERRLAAEVRNCITAWMEANNDSYPLPAPLDTTDAIGMPGTLFGRVPLSQHRNLAGALATARTQLDTARTQITNRTAATQRAAILAMIRAAKSLMQVSQQTSATASMSTSGSALKTALRDTGLDPLASLIRQKSAALGSQYSATPTSPSASELAALGLAARNLVSVLSLTSTPNSALSSALSAQLTATQNTLTAADAGDAAATRTAAAAAVTAASATLTTLAQQRADTPSALTRNRAASLVSAANLASAPLISSAAQDLITTVQSMSTPSTSLASAAQAVTTAANATLSSATASNALLTAAATETLASALDNHGDNLSVSTLDAGATPARESLINSALSQLISSASSTASAANNLRTLAESMLSVSNQTSTNFNNLATRAASAALAASQIALDAKTGKVAILWPESKPDCSWIKTTATSGWIKSQWSRHVFYQVAAPKITRDAAGTPQPGTLSVNGRSGYNLVVLTAGRALPAQSRARNGDPAVLFEGANAHTSRSGGGTNPSRTFEQRPSNGSFNDQLAY